MPFVLADRRNLGVRHERLKLAVCRSSQVERRTYPATSARTSGPDPLRIVGLLDNGRLASSEEGIP